MAQGKQGIWMLTFPDRENAGNLVNLIFTRGKLATWKLLRNFAIKCQQGDVNMVVCSCSRKRNLLLLNKRMAVRGGGGHL